MGKARGRSLAKAGIKRSSCAAEAGSLAQIGIELQAGILSKRNGQINGKLVSIQNRIGTNGIARSQRSLINIKRTAIRKLLLKASNFHPVAVQLVIQASSIAVDFHEQIRQLS